MGRKRLRRLPVGLQRYKTVPELNVFPPAEDTKVESHSLEVKLEYANVLSNLCNRHAVSLSLPDKRGSSHVLLIYLYLAQHIYTSFARSGNYGGVFGRVHLSCELKKICQFIFKCDFSSGAK